MKTIRIKEINGFQIIKSFDQLPIDPAETRLKNIESIKNLPEATAISEKIQAKNSYNAKAKKALMQGRAAQFYVDNSVNLLNDANTQAENDKILIDVEKARAAFKKAGCHSCKNSNPHVIIRTETAIRTIYLRSYQNKNARRQKKTSYSTPPP